MLDDVDATFQVPRATVRIGGRRFNALSIEIEHGFDIGTSQARIKLSDEDTARVGTDFHDLVEVGLGYNTWEVPGFTGFLENDDPKFWPGGNIAEASGPMKRTHYEYGSEVSYESQRDTTIIADLLTRSGVDNASIDGPEGDEELTLGTVEPVILRAGSKPLDLMRLIDEAAGWITFDSPDGIVRRRRAAELPSSTAAFTYRQGVNLIDISAPRSTSDMRNQVTVTGLAQGNFIPSATQQADNSYILTPPGYVALNYSNDLLETNAVCAVVAVRLLRRENRIRREITILAPGNPFLVAGMTIAIVAAKVGLLVPQTFVIKHVHHTYSSGKFQTRVTVEGGVGPDGYPVVTSLIPPEPVISMVITAEAWDIEGVTTRVYTTSCNGWGSYDSDSPQYDEDGGLTLTFDWSNNKNADVSTTPDYSTWFTVDELPDATITLTVTDRDGLETSVTVNVESNVTPIITRSLWLALDDVARASTDGGLSWTEFEAPYADASIRRVTTVAEIGRDGYNYFGMIGSKGGDWDLPAHWLVLVDMARAEADRLVPLRDFGTDAGYEVTAIWAHEFNAQRIVVGLANGQVWASSNIDEEKFAQWKLLVTLPDRIEWLVESIGGVGEIRAAAGESLYITFDNFQNYAELTDFSGGTAYRMALSPFGNFVSGDLSPDAVLNEDGTAIPLPGSPSLPILGLTHHIRRAELYAGDQAGQTYRLEEGETEFIATGAISSGAAINHMIRDGDNEGVYYIAAADGIYKTWNNGDNIEQVLTWDAMTYPDRAGLRIGYGGPVPDEEEAGHGGCYTDFYNQLQFTDYGTFGIPAYLMHASREGSSGPYQQNHAFALDGTWYVKLIAMGPIGDPEHFIGLDPVTVKDGSHVGMGTLREVGDEVDLYGHGSWILPFDYWYINAPGHLNELPSYYQLSVCRRSTAPTATEFVLESSADAKYKLVSGANPPGWRTLAYPDGDWAAMVERAGADDLYTTAPLIWRNDDASPPAEAILIRHAIEITGMDTITDATLVIRCNNSIAGIWINDNYARAIPASGDVSGDSEPFEIPISPSALVVGDNVLAIHAVNNASTVDDATAWVSYRLIVGGE